MQSIIVVYNPKDLEFNIPGVEVVSARTYLTNTKYSNIRKLRVFNLSRYYRYQSTGYYVSLIAEARGHKAIPNITTIQDFKSKATVRVISDEIDELIQKSFRKLKSERFTLSIYFGQNTAKEHEALSRKLYNLFQAPFLRAHFVLNNSEWILQNISPISVREIPEEHKPFVVRFANEYFSTKRFNPTNFTRSKYDLAILINPEEEAPPSTKKVINFFLDAAESLGFNAELITKEDYNRIAEFDALFIRETTSVNHHTYKFSRRAFAEGLVVMDDPVSILKCCNKVYLAEVLTKAKIPIPKTLIVHKDNRSQVEKEIGFPCVLKKPDSSFSQGVIKVQNNADLQKNLDALLDLSDLVIAQEFLPTEFDWRIGIIDGKPLFACKYYMAKDHWQIYNWIDKHHKKFGKVETLPVENVPHEIIESAVKAANLIGNGFYGVDLKMIHGKTLVIEVNDNPSLEDGEEDKFLGKDLYTTILKSFLRRIEQNKILGNERKQ